MGALEWNIPCIFKLIYGQIRTHLGKNKELAYPVYKDFMFLKKKKGGKKPTQPFPPNLFTFLNKLLSMLDFLYYSCCHCA